MEVFPIALIAAAALVVLFFLMRLVVKRYTIKHKADIYKLEPSLFLEFEQLSKQVTDGMELYDQFIEELGLNHTIECSSAIVSSATRDPSKYIVKYSDIEYDRDSLDKLDFIRAFLDNRQTFLAKSQKVRKLVVRWEPLLFKLFVSRKKIAYQLTGVDYKLTSIKESYLHFLYESPAGNSSREYTAEIGQFLLKEITSDISEKLTKKGHTKAQRAAMTADLREAVKQRDNYTCQKCGNSVLKEPNLLLEVDHIIPVAKGGKTEADNLQTLCWRCNRAKGVDAEA